MTHLWRKHLFHHADLVFTLPVGVHPHIWNTDMHESLIIGIFLPFVRVAPWSRRNCPTVLDVAGTLSDVWAEADGNERAILRQLWNEPGGGAVRGVH